MDNIGAQKSPFSKIHHVGVIVRDMDKAVEYYQSLGLGPFKPSGALVGEVTIAEGMYRDKPYTAKTIIRKAQVGGIELELLQNAEGESLDKEFLESRGEGINHIAFVVDDIDKDVDKLVKKGFDVIFRIKFQEGGGCAYFDTSKIGGVLIELVQPPPAKGGKIM